MDVDGKEMTVARSAVKGEERKQPAEGKRLPGLTGKQATLETPQVELPVTYRLIEATALTPSHDALSFVKNPRYPAEVQERAYHSEKEAQNRVIEQARDFKPHFFTIARAVS